MNARSTYLALTIALFTAVSCTSTSSQGSIESEDATGDDEYPWLEASANLEEQIRRQAERLPWSHGMDRVELIHWFAGIGEPAYLTLLEMAADPRADVAGSALAALGATRDSRLVAPIRALPGTGLDPSLTLERSRTLLRLGDWSAIPPLIDGLESERVMTRALCMQALFEATRERFGFEPKGSPEERAASVARWRAWAREHSADPLLGPKIGTTISD